MNQALSSVRSQASPPSRGDAQNSDCMRNMGLVTEAPKVLEGCKERECPVFLWGEMGMEGNR